jgi:predicted tellurium resistance membrane protein TerC
MIEILSDPNAWISLLILTLMEVVLGIDNIVFITLMAARLPRERQLLGRRLGLAVALISRVALLLGIAWVIRLEDELFVFVVPWSGKDLILLAGGMFLLYKATREIYENVEHPDVGALDPEPKPPGAGRAGMVLILLQILALDIVFSLDSVITAVGMADYVAIMIVAILIAVVVMMIFAGPVGDFVQDNPSVRILALAFLVLIGVMLIMESTGSHVSKGYIYSAMGFSLFVQVLNMRRDRRARRAQG